MAGRRVADWRFPTEKQARAEETARNMSRAAQQKQGISDGVHTTYAIGPADPMPDSYWDAVLADPRAEATRPPPSSRPRRLADARREAIRFECLRCFRIVEVTVSDAIKLYGGQAPTRDVGRKLLEQGCMSRTGSRDDDGCWPDIVRT
ncbi:hypothetical protein [Tardiphaga sp.]|jgi:hypothetical protein|uniref:hypothetical protein n=1 Tax=Tardiphaga sp. TaxID=1926292 RepID=UPI0037D9AEC7